MSVCQSVCLSLPLSPLSRLSLKLESQCERAFPYFAVVAVVAVVEVVVAAEVVVKGLVIS